MTTGFTWADEYCPKCGKPYANAGYPVPNTAGEFSYCTCPSEEKSNVFYQYGWVCPLCGRVNAPWVGVCEGYHNNLGHATTTNQSNQ